MSRLLVVRGPALRRLASVLVVGVCLLGLTSCRIQTANAPTGSVHLTAEFDDVQELLIGHNVEVANVVVGSVQEIVLDGFKAKVTMSILDGRNIPVGTTAVIKRTSLLGEHFVDLVFPASFDQVNGPFLKDGDVIAQTSEQPDFEDLVHQASDVISAITADDVSSVIKAGYQGIGGKGPELHELVGQLATLTGQLAAQSTELGATVDGLGQLGATLAPASPQIGQLIDDVAATSQTLATNRDRFVATLHSLVDLATVANQTILGPHAQALHDLLLQVDPLLQTLVDGKATLEQLIPNVERFTDQIQFAIRHDDLMVLAWLFLGTPSSQTAAAPASDPIGDLVNAVVPAP